MTLPSSTAPASRNRATAGESSFQGWLGSMVRDPRKVGQPRVSRMSFTATGTPSSGESGASFAQRSSEARACAKVVASSIRQKALTLASSLAIRASSDLATSTGESSALSNAADRRGAFHCQSSAMPKLTR